MVQLNRTHAPDDARPLLFAACNTCTFRALSRVISEHYPGCAHASGHRHQNLFGRGKQSSLPSLQSVLLGVIKILFRCRHHLPPHRSSPPFPPPPPPRAIFSETDRAPWATPDEPPPRRGGAVFPRLGGWCLWCGSAQPTCAAQPAALGGSGDDPVGCVTRRKQHQPGITPNDNTTTHDPVGCVMMAGGC